MNEAIRDEFTNLPISRQRKYQLRMKRDKRCKICGELAVNGTFCLKHLVDSRERARKKLGCKRRYYNAPGYQFEARARVAARRKRSNKLG